jgi:hypothetical protein
MQNKLLSVLGFAFSFVVALVCLMAYFDVLTK